MSRLLDITNIRFCKLVALNPINVRPRKWLCRCDCGNNKEILQTHLIQGNIRSCGCIRNGSSSPCWTGFGEISGDRFNSFKSKMRHKELGFNITVEQAWDLFLKQDRKCALSGLPLIFGKTNNDISTASLDRIDSNKGYQLNNIQWVHKKINIMKNLYNQCSFIDMCKLVTYPLQKVNKNFTNETKFSKNKWRDICRRKKIVKLGFNINEQYILNLFNSQTGCCSLTGLPIIINIYGKNEYANIASLDRIDPRIGYIEGNVQWVHKMINRMKGCLSNDEFIEMCSLVVNNIKNLI